MLDLGQKRLHKGGGNCLKNPKWGWNRKEGKENKDFKKKGGGAQTGSGCLRAGTTLRTMRNLEEILRIFVFTDLIKKVKFSTPVSILKGLQTQFLIDFFFAFTSDCSC